jgi:hypothetical protein
MPLGRGGKRKLWMTVLYKLNRVLAVGIEDGVHSLRLTYAVNEAAIRV